MNTYQEVFLPAEGRVHRVCLHRKQVEGLPSQDQELGTDVHAAHAKRLQTLQLCQHCVRQGPLQNEPSLREDKEMPSPPTAIM